MKFFRLGILLVAGVVILAGCGLALATDTAKTGPCWSLRQIAASRILSRPASPPPRRTNRRSALAYPRVWHWQVRLRAETDRTGPCLPGTMMFRTPNVSPLRWSGHPFSRQMAKFNTAAKLTRHEQQPGHK